MSIQSVSSGKLIIRQAVTEDIPNIQLLMERAISKLQVGFLTPKQIAASSQSMGLDTQLIQDGSYFCALSGDDLAGCGGWSFRATLYGGNHSADRDATKLDPLKDRARIRAMYTDPDYTRRGVGTLILAESEKAAKARGFKALEMAATLAGAPFYMRCGYSVESRWTDNNGAVPVPLLTMVKVFGEPISH